MQTWHLIMNLHLSGNLLSNIHLDIPFPPGEVVTSEVVRGDYEYWHYGCDKVTISSTFYEQLLCQNYFAKILPSQTVIRENLGKALSYTKDESKMLVKLTPDCWDGQFLVWEYHSGPLCSRRRPSCRSGRKGWRRPSRSRRCNGTWWRPHWDPAARLKVYEDVFFKF